VRSDTLHAGVIWVAHERCIPAKREVMRLKEKLILKFIGDITSVASVIEIDHEANRRMDHVECD
jgi:hypothetical protein